MKELIIRQAPAIEVFNGRVEYCQSNKPRNVQTIDTFVIHSMWNSEGVKDAQYSAEACVLLLLNFKEGYSCHYFVDREGIIWESVSEEYMAWQAGQSRMPAPDGREKVNFFSVGVELIGNEIDGFTEEQYVSLVGLIAQVMIRLPIQNIVGHSDIAGAEVRPEEPKTDPWNFDWVKFWGLLRSTIGEKYENLKIVGSTSLRM